MLTHVVHVSAQLSLEHGDLSDSKSPLKAQVEVKTRRPAV